jgi:type III restriction enzyme
MKATLLNKGRPSLAEPGATAKLDLEKWRAEKRLQEREFEMAAALTRSYAELETCEAPPQVLFPQLLAVVKRFVREKVEVGSADKRVDVFLAPYWGLAIERLTEGLHPDTTEGEAPEIPRYETGRGAGSTSDVDFWTSKKVKEVQKSHLNYVVQDSKWEQSAAYHLDTHPRVAGFVKNQGLGFAIPYLHNGQQHNYVPDFIVRLDNGVHLILETKGHDPLEDVKTQAAERWVRAVDADGSFGEWRYAISHEMNAIPQLLNDV